MLVFFSFIGHTFHFPTHKIRSHVEARAAAALSEFISGGGCISGEKFCGWYENRTLSVTANSLECFVLKSRFAESGFNGQSFYIVLLL